ncbi:copper chaperone PCu(A)C [Croceicoccus sp. BE223]|uniref:copper chaperone PCu(A)C n=1 Tax=Croceicoccus sp. BE223 TaxID=2817716 RepID=UPI0028617F89|nr:copper chaperone PCu(A)C [Croceicoccus sp. BE223]MDR7103263.1 copper(I)-binding protein [Croceicoccus sp. BE223]
MSPAPRCVTVLAALCLPLGLAACGAQEPASQPADGPATEAVDVSVAADAPAGVSLSDAEVRMPAVAGRPGVAYFRIASETPRRIVGISVLGAGRAEIHETGFEGGRMTMAKVDSVNLQPGEPVVFQSGGYHVMLFDMASTLAAGGTADLTITFDNGETASIAARVVGPGGMAAQGAGPVLDLSQPAGDMEGMDHSTMSADEMAEMGH